MRQRKKQLLTFLLLAAAILAFCLLWQPKVAGGVEISLSTEVRLPDYLDLTETRVNAVNVLLWKAWLDIVTTDYLNDHLYERLRGHGCSSPELSWWIRPEDRTLVIHLSCGGCQLVGKFFKCSQQIQEEVKK